MTTEQSVAAGAAQLNGTAVAQHVDRYNSKVTVVLGAQWGDEGKGKVVDMLATEVDIVCRCQVSSVFPSSIIMAPFSFTSIRTCI